MVVTLPGAGNRPAMDATSPTAPTSIGKLFMIWSSGGNNGYTLGIAISSSGKLAGPWEQQTDPIYQDDGGHGMLFTTFDGKLIMVLHSPNSREARPRLFEMKDTGETLRIAGEFTGAAETK
jgi:hypothetical protein